MKKVRLTVKSFFAVLMIGFVCFVPVACSCNEMTGDVIYNNYVNFINKEGDIFEFNEKQEVVIKINYHKDIENALNLEKEAYDVAQEIEAGNPVSVDGNKPAYVNDGLYSDFYIVKTIYEPMLNKSIAQISKTYSLLNAQKDQLNKEKCNTLNENLKALEVSSQDFVTMLDKLNSRAIEFKLDNGKYPYREQANTGGIYGKFKDYKKNYENLIRDCFVLNNTFMDIYVETLGDYSFKKIDQKDFLDPVKNSTILPIVDNYLNYMVSVLSYVAFIIDGNSCSFITSNNPFSQLYANKKENSFANEYIYIEHYSKVADLKMFDLSHFGTLMTSEYLDEMILCQNRFGLLNQQLSHFLEASSKVNYKDYVIQCGQNEAVKTDYLQYALTLDIEAKNQFITVKEFLDNYFLPLATCVGNFQKTLGMIA